MAVEATGLAKRFGATRALGGVDLAVASGSVYGLLGPNGAGKTTMVRILATLLAPDSGQARVLGHDVAADPGAVRRRIALAGQFVTVDDDLTSRENLVVLGRLAGLARRAAKDRAAELLAACGLEKPATQQVKTYSGGMRRRLDLAVGLLLRTSQAVMSIGSAVLFPLTLASNVFVAPRPCPAGCRRSSRPTRSATSSPPSAHSCTATPPPGNWPGCCSPQRR